MPFLMSQPKLKSTSPNRKLDTYVSAAKEIEQEKQMVAALKRLSIGHLMLHDPDLPLESASYSFALDHHSPTDEDLLLRDDSSEDSYSSSTGSLKNRYSYAELCSLENDKSVSVPFDESTYISTTEDVKLIQDSPDSLRRTHKLPLASEDQPLDAELLWVPANMHPEINPQQFKIHLKSTVDELLEQQISRTLLRSRSKRSSLSFSVADSDPEDSTVFMREVPPSSQVQPRKQYSNPSLRELTSELQAMSRLAGMDATDVVTLARTLSSASTGYSDVEKLAFDEMGNQSHPEKYMYGLEYLDDTSSRSSYISRRTLPQLRVNTVSPSLSPSEHYFSSSFQNSSGIANVQSVAPFNSDYRTLSSVDEEFSLRRSRRPDYRKGPGSVQISSQQLGSKLQISKAGKLAELRQSLSLTNIAQNLPMTTPVLPAYPLQDSHVMLTRDREMSVMHKKRSQNRAYPSAAGPATTALLSQPGPNAPHRPNEQHCQNGPGGPNGKTRPHIQGLREGPQTVQNQRYRNPTGSCFPQGKYTSIPLNPSESPYYSPYSEDSKHRPLLHQDYISRRSEGNGSKYGGSSAGYEKRDLYGDRIEPRDDSFRYTDGDRRLKIRALSAGSLQRQNVTTGSNRSMRSPHNLSSNQKGRVQFDQNGYPVQQHSQKQQFYSRHRQHPHSHQQAQYLQGINTQGPHPQDSHLQNNQAQSTHPQIAQQYPTQLQSQQYHQLYFNQQHVQKYHQYHHYNQYPASQVILNESMGGDSEVAPEAVRKGSRSRETQRELNENLDLLRNEINEFKESLSKSVSISLVKTDKAKETNKDDAVEPEDFDFDLTTHDVSYEDSLGIEKNVNGDMDTHSQMMAIKVPGKDISTQAKRLRKEENVRGSKQDSTSSTDFVAWISELAESSQGVTEPEHDLSTVGNKITISRAETGQLVNKPYESELHEREIRSYEGEDKPFERDAKPYQTKPYESNSLQSVTYEDKQNVTRPARSAEVTLKAQKKVRKEVATISTSKDTEGKKTSRKPWPWSKNKSRKLITDVEVPRKAVRSASTPDLASNLETSENKDNVISKFFKKKRSQSASGEKNIFEKVRRRSSSDSAESTDLKRQYSARNSEDSKASTHSRDLADNVTSRIKQKLKNIKRSYEKQEKTAEGPAIPEERAETEEETVEVRNLKPLSTLEVQERLKKSIMRTSRANQALEFTDSAFGFPLPPPSRSTLVMIDYRFPVHVERAIYRLSHLKLANPKRSFREQVLLSNFMYAYLNLVDHTLHLELMTLEFQRPDTEMDILGTQDADTELDTDTLDEEDIDSIKIDLEVRDRISV